jgi:Tfp pilus assembly protein PilN
MSLSLATAKINLAPEIYQNSQRDKRHRKIALTLGTLVSVIALGVIVAAGVILTAQTVAIKLLRQSVTSDENQLQTYPNLVNAATAQEHLSSWQQLNQQKVYMSRFFSVLQDVAPQGIAVTNLALDQENNLQLTGTAQSYSLASKFAQALSASNTQVGPGASPSKQPYFNDVQITSLSSDQQGEIDFQLTTQMSTGVVTNGN